MENLVPPGTPVSGGRIVRPFPALESSRFGSLLLRQIAAGERTVAVEPEDQPTALPSGGKELEDAVSLALFTGGRAASRQEKDGDFSVLVFDSLGRLDARAPNEPVVVIEVGFKAEQMKAVSVLVAEEWTGVWRMSDGEEERFAKALAELNRLMLLSNPQATPIRIDAEAPIPLPFIKASS